LYLEYSVFLLAKKRKKGVQGNGKHAKILQSDVCGFPRCGNGWGNGKDAESQHKNGVQGSERK